jgi:peptidoglycan/LPS O-acetylase OafA/YrhL
MPHLLETLRGPGALRLLLALVVVVHHVSRVALGTAAVYVFFVLSGFWIWRMWQSKYSRARAPYATFMVSRVWRLLPVFLVVSGVTLVSGLHMQSGLQEYLTTASPAEIDHFGFSSLLILGYSSLSFTPVGPAWSLDIELQFYLLAPVFIYLLARWPVALLGAAVALAVSLAAGGFDRSLPIYLIFFLIGMRICQTGWQPTGRTVTVASGVAVVLVVAASVMPQLRPMLLGGAHPGAMHEQWSPFFNLAMAALVLPYAIATTTRSGGAHDGLFADMAYVVYLLHWVMAVALADLVSGLSTAQRLAVTALWFVAMLAASYLVWRFVDQPFNRLRMGFVRGRMAGERSSSAGSADGASRA